MMWDVIMAFEDNIYLPGDFVCRYGEQGDGMHFILKGCCAILISNLAQILGYKSQGDYFGEISLLTEARRSAYVRAEAFCTIAFLEKMQFNEILAAETAPAGHPKHMQKV